MSLEGCYGERIEIASRDEGVEENDSSKIGTLA